MQTRSLRSLVKIAQVGSFLRAAEQLNMTLSALSMQMKALEAELGVSLFDRSVRPPRLTPIGGAVMAKASEMLANENALRELCSNEADLAGRFRIGFVTSAAARLLPRFLENARMNLQRATFDFETGLSKDLQDQVQAGTLDAAVVTDSEVNLPGLTQIELRREPFAFAFDQQLAPESVADMIRECTFFHFMPQTGIGRVIARAMGEFGIPSADRTVILDNLEAIMGAVNNGLGYTLLPEPDVDRYAAKHVIKRDPPKPVMRSLVLILRAENLLAKRKDLLIDQFGA